MAQALPNLQSVRWELPTVENRFQRTRREQRCAIGRIMLDLSFKFLTELWLREWRSSIRNHDFRPGCVCAHSTEHVDLLGHAINQICQRCPVQKLVLDGHFIISTEMFQLPPDGGELWPSMQVVKMDASLLTAGGGWFLKGDGEHQTTHLMPEDCYTTRRMQNGHDPINLWRDRVDPRSYDPLMHKLAKAMLQMPKLQRLKLEFPNWYSSSSQGKCPSLEYYLETPSIRTRTSPRKASVWILDCNRSVYWPYPETGLFWEIPDHIMAAYRQLVKDDSIIQRVRYRIQLPSGRFPWLWA